MFDRVLVVLDPARDFGPAQDYAVELVKRWTPSVVGMYTAFEEAAPFKAAYSEATEPQRFVGKKAVQRFRRRLREAVGRDLDYTPVVAEGPYEVTIPEVAARESADLIVLGSFHSGVERALVGSDTERVIEYSPCSVLLIRNPCCMPTEGSTLAFAHDSPRVSNVAVEQLKRLCLELGLGFKAVVGVPPKSMEEAGRTAERVTRAIEGAGVTVHPPQVLTSRWILGPHGVVHRAVVGLQPGMVAMVRRRHAKGKATHWLVHEFVADTTSPTLFLK